jgi:hypothetical protein
MARSSYFLAIAPAAGPPQASQLAPAPPLFRQSAAPASFLAIDSWSESPRAGAGGRRPVHATRPDGAAPPGQPDSAVSKKLGSDDKTPLVAPLDAALAPAPRIARAAIDAILPRSAIESAPPRSDMRPPGAGTTEPASESERRPRHNSQSATATPAITLQPPVPRPSAKLGSSGPAGGVHIGTLEVRVAAPVAAAQAAPAQAGRPRFVRPPALRQAQGSTRLSRGFAVFGLGQS